MHSSVHVSTPKPTETNAKGGTLQPADYEREGQSPEDRALTSQVVTEQTRQILARSAAELYRAATETDPATMRADARIAARRVLTACGPD